MTPRAISTTPQASQAASSPPVECDSSLPYALASLDPEQARDLIARQADGLSPRDLRFAADACLARRWWKLAIGLLTRVPDDEADLMLQLKLRLARNLEAMRIARPTVHDTLTGSTIPLADATARVRYRVMECPSGLMTLADCANPNQPMVLSPAGDPAHGLRQVVGSLSAAMKSGSALGLCGLGDGYLLSHLSRNPPDLFMDQQQVVHVIEPDPHLLVMCFALHDYTGPSGPIADERFRWYVGPGWSSDYRAAVFADTMLPPPVTCVQVGPTASAIKSVIDRVTVEYDQLCERLRLKVRTRDASRSTDELIDLFSDDPPRRPRVLLLTSRFTTVLQYATRDAAAAFTQLGWDTHTIIEPSPRHRPMHLAMLEQLDAFDPDVVFMIDHLRREQGQLLPPNIPVITWVQDHLPNLTSREAAASITPRDFILTFASPLFIDQHGYPPTQCIDVPMMWTSALKRRDEDTSQTGDDLVYVSNVSGVPSELAARIVDDAAGSTADLTRVCVECLLALYEAGDAVPTLHDLRALVGKCDASNLNAQSVEDVVQRLWNPLNIALYRQQALGWVAESADALGLSLALFGQGWENNPRFAAFARGPVEHGKALQGVTRLAKVSLVLEPYPCFVHHRMLDGLAAGGFMLVRDHPANRLLQRLANKLDDDRLCDVQSRDDALRAVADDQRDALEALIDEAAGLDFSNAADPVRQVRCWQRAGAIVAQSQALPRLDEVTFAGPAQCRARIESLINNPAARRTICDAQWANVKDRLTFNAGLRRVVSQMRERLAAEAGSVEQDRSAA